MKEIVVPRAGTWIETMDFEKSMSSVKVVPRAGTWIETYIAFQNDSSFNFVVPRAGTWIETRLDSLATHGLESFPVRERGLKPNIFPHSS